jgi:prefoldin subunit 5
MKEIKEIESRLRVLKEKRNKLNSEIKKIENELLKKYKKNNNIVDKKRRIKPKKKIGKFMGYINFVNACNL